MIIFKIGFHSSSLFYRFDNKNSGGFRGGGHFGGGGGFGDNRDMNRDNRDFESNRDL